MRRAIPVDQPEALSQADVQIDGFPSYIGPPSNAKSHKVKSPREDPALWLLNFWYSSRIGVGPEKVASIETQALPTLGVSPIRCGGSYTIPPPPFGLIRRILLPIALHPLPGQSPFTGFAHHFAADFHLVAHPHTSETATGGAPDRGERD